MKMYNIHEVKAHLSQYLSQLKPGQVLVICRRNKPIAELRALPRERTKSRPIGLGKGTLTIPPEFFDPLPDGIVSAFEGDGT